MDWRTYERHPLSAQYEDLTPEPFANFVANLKQHGIVNGRKIVLHDGKILDGWQLQRACIEADVQPEYKELPKGIEPESFVETVNDQRRHENQHAATKRIRLRRERVAAAVAEGKSERTIADEEGVSQTTIRNDKKNSGEHPQSPEPEKPVVSADTTEPETTKPPKPTAKKPAKVKGKDGKTYPATKPEPILCRGCQAAGKRAGCPACKIAREGKEPPKSGKPKFDDRIVDELWRKLVKAIDERAEVFGKSTGYKNMDKAVAGVKHAWDQWRVETK